MRHAHLPLRVQFNRSELLTEVVQDIDIMPVDPYENLPVNIPLVPSSLNGRPRPVQGVARRRVVVRGRAREGSEEGRGEGTSKGGLGGLGGSPASVFPSWGLPSR